ncbi:unnamed protein product [Spodoptera exigua]|nr:unnamed protein product [Spodoptera exigua]
MESTMEYINSPSPSGFPMNHIMWGLCIPAACSPPAVSKLTRVVYEAATFSSIASDVTVKHCQEAGETLPYSTGFYIFIALVLTLKNKTIGFVSYAVVAVFSMVIPGVLTYLLQLPGVLFSEYGKYIIRYRETWEFSFIYTAFYSRASTYLVGVAMGYLMHMYKPDDHRNSISKKWSTIGIAMSFITMSVTMSLGYILKQRGRFPIEASIIAATNRVFWAAAICCIIGMCEYGTVRNLQHPKVARLHTS